MTWLSKAGGASDNVVSVTPVDGGWSVTSGLADHPLMFMSGAHAEAKARSLAQLIAAAGGDAQVIVHDRRNTLIGTVRYFAAEAVAADFSGSETSDPTAA
ncbi:MAG: hypothetical protein Q8L59_12900 [Phenylobacterium sp.]|jgi:hypothetical protein|uniref:hypothetical protein n=1 Tax=Phenylobacterium sp. TaxID=1871053 RepID=UPI002736248C|nr:hypothetical protein [Phenylobacterium sp.]MBW0151067.1 hypothetical protein [Phenylobacterium sp.]MDP1643070.1 hypothetical protein [Phenylobacterium sp.]MDP3117236.1 hypothetical protein [Phenylobacterium sp.]MDZ4317863.1 hypothetical protein [Phenylobacterium sp.]